MYGILIAFQDFIPGDSIFSTNAVWVGFDNFKRFFEIPNFKEIFWNTFTLCFFGFIVGFPLPIIVALLLNSLKSKKLQKTIQTIFYAPHFISLVVLVGMLYLFFGSNGLISFFASTSLIKRDILPAEVSGTPNLSLSELLVRASPSVNLIHAWR